MLVYRRLHFLSLAWLNNFKCIPEEMVKGMKLRKSSNFYCISSAGSLLQRFGFQTVRFPNMYDSVRFYVRCKILFKMKSFINGKFLFYKFCLYLFSIICSCVFFSLICITFFYRAVFCNKPVIYLVY